MNELQKVFKYGESPVRTVVKGEEVWFVLTDVCKVLELSTPSRVKDRLPKNSTDFCIMKDRLDRKQKITIINQKALISVVSCSRSHKAIDFAKSLGLEVNNLITFSKEQETIEIIAKSFSHLEQVRQYHVDGFFIDLYFPEYKIAIECDEKNHSHQNYTNDKGRELRIKKITGCKFIRFNPDKKDFNIGDVINQILREVYGSVGNSKVV